MIRKKLSKLNETLLDLIIGIIFVDVIVAVLGIIITKGNIFCVQFFKFFVAGFIFIQILSASLNQGRNSNRRIVFQNAHQGTVALI